MAPPPVIQLESITMVRGDDRTILSGIDWTLHAGEHWALLGANGSGKTSLLKIVCGYEWPTDGVVRVLGEAYGEVPIAEVRKRIGWVSSSLQTWVHDEDTALEVVVSGFEASFGLWREFTEKEFGAARRTLADLDAEALTEKPYAVLSQGEKQRVLIARAWISRPDLLILDEPCAGLDPVSRASFLNDLTRFAKRRRAPTLIFVTHHVEEIPPFINRALVLKEGRILASGALGDVCTSPVMSDAFGEACEITRDDTAFRLCVRPASRGQASRASITRASSNDS
jgi:iron complex transport system ATP-binding protein